MNLKTSLALCAGLATGASTFLVTAIAAAAPPVPASFDSSLYRPMDLQRHCRQTYGASASVVLTGDHAYEWKCQRGGTRFSLSMDQVCARQWGRQYSPVLLGAHAYDWACVSWSEARHRVAPLVIVARDYMFDISRVSDGVAASAAALERVRAWYADAMDTGQTFEAVRPVVHLSLVPAAEWNALSCITGQIRDRDPACPDQTSPPDRFVLLERAVEEAERTSLGSTSEAVVVPIFIYTGNHSEGFWLGAASQGKFAMVPPDVASCGLDEPFCGLYALGHEIGHNFGLIHACEYEPRSPDCGSSIMQNPGNIAAALLLPEEQAQLRSSPYFSAP